MIYIEQSELIHKKSDVLYPVKITRKSSGKTAFHLVPFGLTKTHYLLEVEDASEAIRLVIDENVISFAAVHLQQLLRIKRASELARGTDSIKGGVNIKEYNVR
ncbi:transposase [Shigella boydii]